MKKIIAGKIKEVFEIREDEKGQKRIVVGRVEKKKNSVNRADPSLQDKSVVDIGAA